MSDRKKCHASVMLMRGNGSVDFTTRAKTRKGILKATGRAVARKFMDDAIDVWCISHETGEPFPHNEKVIRPTLAEHTVIFMAAHDEIFNIRYS